MSKKITSLTEAQEKRLVDLRSEWLAIGYDTLPLDRKTATEIVGELYSRIGKPKPVVMFFDSPASCILAWGMLKLLFEKVKRPDQLSSQLRDQLSGQLRGQLFDQLHDQLFDQLSGQLFDQLHEQLFAQLRDQLFGQLFGQLR